MPSEIKIDSQINIATTAAFDNSVKKLEQLGKSNSTNKAGGAENAAREFEALLLHRMLQDMWSSIPNEEGPFGSGKEEGMYRDMLNEAMAKSISEGRGIGLREVIERDLIKLQKK